MRLVEQALIVQRSLNDWAKAERGKAVVVFDQFEFWENLFNDVAYPRVLICYEGEKLRGDFSIAAKLGRVDRQWMVGVSRSRGLNQDRGGSLITKSGNARPFLDLVEEARDLIRSLQGITLEPPVDFISVEPAQRPDALTDAYIIRFSVVDDLPRIGATAAIETPQQVPTLLDSMYVNMPCLITVDDGCTCADPTPIVKTMGGSTGASYEVDFHVIGVFETKRYSGGTPLNGYARSGGDPIASANNILLMEISSPHQYIWLNSSNTLVPPVLMDYNLTLTVDAGATVTLTCLAVDGNQYRNVDNLVAEGFNSILPNQGQEMQLIVTANRLIT